MALLALHTPEHKMEQVTLSSWESKHKLTIWSRMCKVDRIGIGLNYLQCLSARVNA